MRLNPDCVRDILMCVESAGFDKQVQFSTIISTLQKYEEDEVLYHINQCDYSGFFTKVSKYDTGRTGIIYDLTPKAHEFLANIRSNSIWEKTKSTASKIGSLALPALQQIAANLVENSIKNILKS